MVAECSGMKPTVPRAPASPRLQPWPELCLQSGEDAPTSGRTAPTTAFPTACSLPRGPLRMALSPRVWGTHDAIKHGPHYATKRDNSAFLHLNFKPQGQRTICFLLSPLNSNWVFQKVTVDAYTLKHVLLIIHFIKPMDSLSWCCPVREIF